MILKVQNITAPAHDKRVGECVACNIRLVWHAKNGHKIKKVACAKCGGPMKNTRKAHLPTYSVDGVMFDDGNTLEMYTPLEGY